MRVYVSVDMKGVAGVVSRAETGPHEPEDADARMTMTREANAAIDGAVAAGAADVLVADGHNAGRNLLPEALDPRARVVRAAATPLGMMAGIDEGFDAALFVGYHARAGGAGGGVVNHTLASSDLQSLQIDGAPAGETRLNALIAGRLGVPGRLRVRGRRGLRGGA